MEIVIAVFIGLWVSASAAIACRYLKMEYKDIMGNRSR